MGLPMVGAGTWGKGSLISSALSHQPLEGWEGSQADPGSQVQG